MNLSISHFFIASAITFKEGLLRTLTDQQNKILVIALAAFCCLAVCYMFAPRFLEAKEVIK